MQRRYITVKQAASIIGVTPLTLRNWDRAGKLVAYRNPVNNYRLYRLDQIQVLIREIEGGNSKRARRKIDVF